MNLHSRHDAACVQTPNRDAIRDDPANRSWAVRRRAGLALLALSTTVLAITALGQARPALAQFQLDEDPINYYTDPVDDPAARLQRRLDSGQVTLKYEPAHGYLVSLLKELDVPQSSQMLVFSKTSFQRHHISPRTPRALYFNDEVYIGYVQGGDVLEISSVDPRQGAVFYSLDQTPLRKPKVTRQIDRCLLCHASTHTKGVPGHFVRSVYPNLAGMPYFGAGTYRTNQTSPLHQRWGGWYVTGSHGRQRHMGNAISTDRNNPERLDVETGANVTELTDRFDTSKYLTPHSDIVALMVLEHQTDMHNFITLANYQGRLALRDQTILDSLMDRVSSGFSEATRRRFGNAAQRVVDYMLLVDETKLTDPVRGTSDFARQFAARGPRDSKGRSLRDLDLDSRLFKYPCSYLIYSEAFDALPPPVKAQVFRRLWEILTGRNDSPQYAHLCEQDRVAILEIVRDTKPALPSYWTTPPSGG